ncbi:acyl-CoA reductase [Rhodococcus wratislaviensis]|uniref:Long-chain-fatty-acyl-CoA reductase n=1 Tax=Rhodococcus wratislaviensis NBRC 100605 TaxID=1219028 RepID=X0Q827_RHOWR|nr:acyl-CoA reductase [Rhodococcus wratislaviensis]GAF47622.1 hypothetical protein RW1_043_00570 [Rhodococcus wratislaviensis NBRC 100605]
MTAISTQPDDIEKTTSDTPIASMVIRGRVIESNLIRIEGRGGDLTFLTPDVRQVLGSLPLKDPAALKDLYRLTLDDILDYLVSLGEHLRVENNAHLQQARALSYMTAPTTPPLIDHTYERLPAFFERDRLFELAEQAIGVEYLEGWVPRGLLSGATANIRCFGARAVHIVAGNNPIISVMTIVRNALLRSDAIIKAPSNDPFTALAVARTMVDMDATHPVTKHLSVAYWKGGDGEIEAELYKPANVEKVVAWGGLASVKHITQYVQPGLELISLDPKRSVSIIGVQAFADDETMREVAVRLATDIGAVNQQGCVNARVVYVMSGTDAAGVGRANLFGQLVYDAMLQLPTRTSTKPKRYDRSLRESVDSVRMQDDWYHVVGGRDDEGAIIVSQLPEPVPFALELTDRTANIVPVDTIDEIVGAVNAWTQTVGVYPEELKTSLRDVLPLYGAQRLVSLGYAAASAGSNAGRQDAIEPMRRMGKWIVDEAADPELVPPLWQ